MNKVRVTICLVIILSVSVFISCKAGINSNNKNVGKEVEDTTIIKNNFNNDKSDEIINTNKSNEEFPNTEGINDSEGEQETEDAVNAKDIECLEIDIEKYEVKYNYERYKILYNQIDREYVVCIKDRDGEFNYINLKYPKEPYVHIENSNILVVNLSLGSPGPNYQRYYDLDRDLLSPVYACSRILKENLIYYIDYEKCLTIRDMFFKDVFYLEIYRDFFKAFLNPTFAISSIEIKDNKILLEYYEGEERIETKEVIILN